MEEQRERTGGRRRQRRKAKGARSKVVIEPVLIAARRPDSPLLKNGFRNVVASAQPKAYAAGANGAAANGAANGAPSPAEVLSGANGHERSAADDVPPESSVESRGESAAGELSSNGHAASGEARAAASGDGLAGGVRRRVARIIKLADNVQAPGNREQVLLDRLIHSQGRGAISRAADDLWESKIAVPKRQEIQIQLLEHENEHRARDAVFALAELLQREAPIKRPLLDQRLRRLETSADDPITRDAAGALRRSMRVHHGL